MQRIGESYILNSVSLSQDIYRLENQKTLATDMLSYLNNNQDNKLIPVDLGLEDQATANMFNEFNSIVLQLEKYQASGTTNNPRVKDMYTQLKTLRSNARTLLKSYINSVDLKIQSTQLQEERNSILIGQVPEQQKYLLSIERVLSIKQSLYLSLLTRREELMLSQPSTEPNAKILEPAIGSSAPISPNENKTIMIGLLFGLIFPIGIYYLIKTLDTSVRYKGDVLKGTSTPFLGEIPSREKNDKREIVVEQNKRDAISESFRILRSNIDYFKNDKSENNQVIMFTSFMVAAGKTFVSLNLAKSLAITDKKVIIVDLDIRKATLEKFMAKKHSVGVTNYLSGKINNIDALILKGQESIDEALDIILAGPIPPNPAELLTSKRLDHLIDELRKRYDYIFLDNVPVGMVAEIGRASCRERV